jgi:hypothetical protein
MVPGSGWNWIAVKPSPSTEMKLTKITTLPIKNLISRSPLRLPFLFIALALACFALSPLARAQCRDGCGTNGNTFQGVFALGANTSGGENTAFGDTALNFNTTGSFNTAVGFDALETNKTGSGNTATGFGALFKNTASGNTAFGSSALEFDTTGADNTATGVNALFHNTTASDNTANGAAALVHNTTGSNNTATGFEALANNTTGFSNTASGFQALFNNTTSIDNTANGAGALYSNTTGFYNTANGVNALYSNTTGTENTANGVSALFHNTTGSSNIALGLLAGLNLTTGSNNIDIGNVGSAGEASRIRIGTVGTQNATFIAGISGVAVTGAPVVISSSGQLGVAPSSERFKDEIEPMDKASEAILALKPVTFHYKKELDPEGIPQFGLVAEQVEKVNPDLVARDAGGKVYTVRYEAVNAMLLNEFLKEHRKVESQEGRLQRQEAVIAQQQKQIEALTATMRKVSAQVEISKPAPQVAADTH